MNTDVKRFERIILIREDLTKNPLLSFCLPFFYNILSNYYQYYYKKKKTSKCSRLIYNEQYENYGDYDYDCNANVYDNYLE